MEKRVLLLRTKSLIIYRADKAEFYIERIFRIDDKRIPAAIGQYLSENRQVVYRLIFDLPSEEGYFETLPRIGIKDRKHLLARLSKKYFPEAVVATVRKSKTSPTGAAMVCGVTVDPLLTGLLQQLKQAGTLLAAVYSPLMLTEELCGELQLTKTPGLLVILSENKNCRMIACIEGNAVFVRQVSVDIIDPQALKRPIDETLAYLERQKIEGWVTPKVTLLGGIGDNAGDLKVKSGHGIESGVLDASEHTGLAANTSNAAFVQSLDNVLVRLASRAGNGYENSVLSAFYDRWKRGSAAVAAVVSVVVGAVSTVAVANKLESQYAGILSRYVSAAASHQTMDIDENQSEYSVEAVRQAVVTSKLIDIQAQQSPLGFYTELESLVGNESALTVNSVSWNRQDMLDQQSLKQIIDTPGHIDTLSLNKVFSATINGTVEGSPGTTLDRFDDFVSNLRLTSTLPSVVVVEAPFGLGVDKKTTTADLSASDAKFSISVIPQGGISELE